MPDTSTDLFISCLPYTSPEYEEAIDELQNEIKSCTDAEDFVRPHFVKEVSAELDRIRNLSHLMTDKERGRVVYHLLGSFDGPVTLIDDVSPSDMDAYEKNLRRLLAAVFAYIDNPCTETYLAMKTFDLTTVYDDN